MRWLMIAMTILAVAPATAQRGEDNPSRRGGPTMNDMRRKEALSPHQMLQKMFEAIESQWIPASYEKAGGLSFRTSIQAELPASKLGRGASSGESIDFEIDLEGVATPDGRYRMEMEGGLGQVTMIDDLRRKLIASQGFKAFSDTPHRTRSRNANLTNYRSYLLRHLGRMKQAILESGNYRSVYAGSGTHMGKEVHVIRLYKPSQGRSKRQGRQPVPLRKLWTFWHDGGYEIWLHDGTYLPAVVFYANNDDNVFANFSIDYNRENMPFRIDFNNGSVGARGRGDLVLDFSGDRILRGISLRYDGADGISISADATLSFEDEVSEREFQIRPPFGFRKMNRDHLKLMILTEISGGLLKLRKHGINFENFKF